MAIKTCQSPYTAIILELLNVVMKTSLDQLTAVPHLTYQSLICCSSTLQFQRNEISYTEYKRRLQAEWYLTPSVIDTMFTQVQGAMTVNTDLLEQLRHLKTMMDGRLQIYAVTNASEKDSVHMASLPVDWTIFDRIFTSADMGMRKPELRCFRHVLQCLSKSPHELIFIDAEPENVLTAQSLGMRGIKSSSAEEIEQLLHSLILDPLSRARSFLRQNAKELHSTSENDTVIKENFAQLLIMEATGDKSDHLLFCLCFKVNQLSLKGPC
jgi:HAD superfamily hydrolase (TIGR01509 family)